MRINITPNLRIEDSDSEVISIIKQLKTPHIETILSHIDSNDDSDCFFVLIDVTKRTEPVDGTLYFIQHFGKIGDSGYVAYILNEVFKNRKELDLITEFWDRAPVKTEFVRGCSQMVRALRFGASLLELLKKDILSTPPPHLN